MAEHIPVLLNETLDYLINRKDGVYMDLTTGEGGHSKEIVKLLEKAATLYCFDRDNDIQGIAKENLKDFKNIKFILSNFSNLKNVLGEEGVGHVSGILADVGLSMFHYKKSDKGFSFNKDAVLDMTLDGASPNASDVVNNFTQEEIADIIFKYGEDRMSRRIASFITQYRREKKIETTLELGDIIKKAVPGSKKKRGFHPATKSFQALRIFVNKEFENLEKMMRESIKLLEKGGRLAIITYHSLEDRIVKHFFKEEAITKKIKILTKKPIAPDREEILKNASARSAKLRVIEKIV